MQLQEFFRQNPRVAVAYSGGVDSSYLLYAAKTAGCDVHAYFIKSQFQPKFELEDAREFTDSLGITLTVAELDALSSPIVAQNPSDRCYHCKNVVFSRLWELCRADGFDVLCDGTNADDDETDRPGMRALRELGVRSPLRECGVAKSDVRRLSREAGLFTHDKPSYACLATRVPTGTAITAEVLQKVERAEQALFRLGFSDFRVRLLPPNGARLQLPEGQLPLALTQRAEITEALRPEFDCVVLDLAITR